MQTGRRKLELVRRLGEVKHNGRVYRLDRERVAGTKIEYNSIKLYNATGRFIKRFCIEPEISADVAQVLSGATIGIVDALYEAEVNAWLSLARYKFQMFGYHAAIWVHLNRLSGLKLPNPWKKLVGVAKKEVGSEKFCRQHPELFSDVEVKR
jgi:hypothetical protein